MSEEDNMSYARSAKNRIRDRLLSAPSRRAVLRGALGGAAVSLALPLRSHQRPASPAGSAAQPGLRAEPAVVPGRHDVPLLLLSPGPQRRGRRPGDTTRQPQDRNGARRHVSQPRRCRLIAFADEPFASRLNLRDPCCVATGRSSASRTCPAAKCSTTFHRAR